MGGNMFSGSSQRREAIATAEAQKQELAMQKAVADASQATALQDSLQRDTNRLLRVFGTRSLLTGGSARADGGSLMAGEKSPLEKEAAQRLADCRRFKSQIDTDLREGYFFTAPQRCRDVSSQSTPTDRGRETDAAELQIAMSMEMAQDFATELLNTFTPKIIEWAQQQRGIDLNEDEWGEIEEAVAAQTTTIFEAIRASKRSKADAQAYNPPSAEVPDHILLLGYAAVGDKGGALYKKVVSEPSHAGKFQIAQGSWYEIAEDVLTPLMFGADPTGTNDSLAAFNAALAVTTAAFVDVPAGTYKISGAIVVGSYKRLRGAGQSVCSLVTSSATADMIRMDGFFCHASGFRFSLSVTRTAGYAVNFTSNCAGSTLDDFYTENSAFSGININATSDTRITNGTINAGASPAVGINVAQGYAVYIGEVIVGCNPAAPSFASMVCTHLMDVTMEYVQLLQSTVNLYINPTTGQEVDSLVYTGCYFDAPVAGGKSLDTTGMSGTGKFQRSAFVNCWFTPGLGGDSVRLLAAGSTIINDLMFIGCKFPPSASNDGTAINAEGAGVSGLIVNGCAIYAHTTGIRLYGVSGAMITGNIIGPGGGFGANGTAISVESTSDYVTVVGNKLNGNATASIASSASGTHNYYAHNPDDGLGIGNTLTLGASPYTYTCGPRPEMLYIRGGTVSNVVTDSGSLGAAPGVVYLQPNRDCQITYSVAPTVVRQVVG